MNFKADSFKSRNALFLYAEASLPAATRVTFTIPGHFLSTLEASVGRFIDFDKELELTLEKMRHESNPKTEIALTYMDNIGFVDASEYHQS